MKINPRLIRTRERKSKGKRHRNTKDDSKTIQLTIPKKVYEFLKSVVREKKYQHYDVSTVEELAAFFVTDHCKGFRRPLREIWDALMEIGAKVSFENYDRIGKEMKKAKRKGKPEAWKSSVEALDQEGGPYGCKIMTPAEYFEQGIFSGKFAALNWIFGHDWEI